MDFVWMAYTGLAGTVIPFVSSPYQTNYLPMQQGFSAKGIGKVIMASSVGTLIEWYDFYIFGMLATIISKQFFPENAGSSALLSTLAIFAAGFIVRPFGALVFGRLGDLIGRKHTFLLTLVLMGGSTFAIGLVPGYKSIGWAAPVLVLLLRLLQGLALGGEYGGAATYVAEHAPEGRRGYFTSWIQTTATLGLFLALGVILLIRQAQGVEQFSGEWGGWRWPFWISILLVGVSVYIRLRMKESPLFSKIKATGQISKNPLKESFGRKNNLKMVLLALFGAVMGQGVIWYTGQFYAQSFIENVCKVNFIQSRNILLVAILFATPFFVVFGALSDKAGRKWIMLTGMLLGTLTYWPMYKGFIHLAATGMTAEKVLDTSTFWLMTLLVFIQIIFVTMVYGPIAAFLVELFPTNIRYTSMSLPYHIGNGVFGGLVPFLGTLIVEYTKTPENPAGNPLAGLWYPICIAGLCFIIGAIYLPGKTKYQPSTQS